MWKREKLQPSSCTCMSGSAHKLACSYFNRTGFINIPIVHMGKECHKNISSRPKTSVLQKAHMCPCSLWSLEHLSLFVHAFVCVCVGHREKPHYSLLHFGAIKTSAPPSPQAPSSPLCTHTHTHTIPPPPSNLRYSRNFGYSTLAKSRQFAAPIKRDISATNIRWYDPVSETEDIFQEINNFI